MEKKIPFALRAVVIVLLGLVPACDKKEAESKSQVTAASSGASAPVPAPAVTPAVPAAAPTVAEPTKAVAASTGLKGRTYHTLRGSGLKFNSDTEVEAHNLDNSNTVGDYSIGEDGRVRCLFMILGTKQVYYLTPVGAELCGEDGDVYYLKGHEMVLTAAYATPKTDADRAKSRENLTKILEGIQQYANAHGGVCPPTIGQISTKTLVVNTPDDPGGFLFFPGSKKRHDPPGNVMANLKGAEIWDAMEKHLNQGADYVYLVGGKQWKDIPPSAVIAYERFSEFDAGLNVIQATGLVKWYERKTLSNPDIVPGNDVGRTAAKK